jgi:hypothetical protein
VKSIKLFKEAAISESLGTSGICTDFNPLLVHFLSL